MTQEFAMRIIGISPFLPALLNFYDYIFILLQTSFNLVCNEKNKFKIAGLDF